MPQPQPQIQTLWETIRDISASVLPICAIAVTFFTVLWNTRENKKARRELLKDKLLAKAEEEKKEWSENMSNSVRELNEGVKMTNIVLANMNISLLEKISATDKKVDSIVEDLKDFKIIHRNDVNKLHDRIDKKEDRKESGFKNNKQ